MCYTYHISLWKLIKEFDFRRNSEEITVRNDADLIVKKRSSVVSVVKTVLILAAIAFIAYKIYQKYFKKAKAADELCECEDADALCECECCETELEDEAFEAAAEEVIAADEVAE